MVSIVITFVIITSSAILQAFKIHLRPTSFCTNYEHYDLVFSTNSSNAIKSTLPDYSNFKHFQYTYVPFQKLASFVKELAKKRLQYGRTILYLEPENIAQLTAYVDMIKILYYQPRNELYFDSRLSTFFRWPVNDGDIEDNNNLLRNYSKDFPLNSEVYVTQEQNLIFKEIYSLKNYTFVNDVHLFRKRLETRECFSFVQLSQRRHNLNGVPITFTGWDSIESKDCINFSTLNPRKKNFSYHSCNQILSHFRTMLNFSIAAKFSQSQMTLERDGVLGGTGKFLQTGEADVAISVTYILPYRLEYLTSLLPIGNEQTMAYLIQPKPSKMSNIYNRPYSRRYWVGIATMVGLIFLTSVIFARFGRGMYNEKNWWSSQNIYWIICVACQQEWHYVPHSLSGKLVLLTTGLAALILHAAYSGSMISGLASEANPISEVGDLVSHNFKLVFDPIVYDRFVHTSDSSDSITEFMRRNELENKFINDSNAIHAVMKGNVAFLATKRNFISAYFRHHQNDSYMCETVSKIPFGSRNLQSGFFIAKGSPLKEVFNSRLVIMLENGLIHHFWKYYYQQNTSVECSEHKFSYRADLGLDDVNSAYLILILGFLGGITSIVVEKWMHFLHKMKIQKYNWANQITF